jgi:hypothetical protein
MAISNNIFRTLTGKLPSARRGAFDTGFEQFDQPDEQQRPGLMSQLGDVGLSGIGYVGNVLDLPGSSVRDVFAGENPLDQWLPWNWGSDSNRVSGRELGRRHGLIGSTDTYGNWWGGMGIEMATDPLSWFSFGAAGAAKTGAGKIAQAAGVLGDAARISGKGKRLAAMTTSLGDLFGGLSRQSQRDALTASLKKAGHEVDQFGAPLGDIASQPLGTAARFEAPWPLSHLTGGAGVNLGSGPLSQGLASIGDAVGDFAARSVPGRAFNMMFESDAMGRYDWKEQELAREVSRLAPEGQRSTRKVLGQAQWDYAQASKRFEDEYGDMVKSTLPSGTSEDEARSAIYKAFDDAVGLAAERPLEGLHGAISTVMRHTYGLRGAPHAPSAWLDNRVGQMTSGWSQANREPYDLWQSMGGRGGVIDDGAAGAATDTFRHVPRYTDYAKTPGKGQVAPTTHGSAMGRESAIRMVPAYVADQIASNSKYKGAQAASDITSDFGQYLNPNHEGGVAKHAEDLAEWAKGKDAAAFTRGKLADLAKYQAQVQKGAKSLEAVHEFLLDNALDGPAADALPLDQAFRQLGLDADQATQFFGDLASQRGKALGTPHISRDVVNAAKATLDLATRPEYQNKLGEAFDTVTRWIKQSYTLPFPRHHVRNLFSGQFMNAASGLIEGAGDWAAYSAKMADAWMLLYGEGGNLFGEGRERALQAARKVFGEDVAPQFHLIDDVAKKWAAEHGRSPDEYYDEMLDSIRKSDPSQVGPGAMPQGGGGFYSKLGQVVDQKVGGKTTWDQLEKTLKNSGVTDEEIADTGLREFFQQRNGLATKRMIQEHLAANGLNLKHEILGDGAEIWPKVISSTRNPDGSGEMVLRAEVPGHSDQNIRLQVVRGNSGQWSLLHAGRLVAQEQSLEKINETTRNFVKSQPAWYSRENPTRWDDMTVPGGDPGTYREHLLKLPETDKSYTNGHWHEHKNQTTHIRTDVVTMPDGKKVLRIHELQDDWAQAARTTREELLLSKAQAEGVLPYKSPDGTETMSPQLFLGDDDISVPTDDETLPFSDSFLKWKADPANQAKVAKNAGYESGAADPASLLEPKRKYDAAKVAARQAQKTYDHYSTTVDSAFWGKAVPPEIEQQLRSLRNAWDAAKVEELDAGDAYYTALAATEGLPDRPLREGWAKHGLRRMIDYAVQKGYDGIGIVKGSDIAEKVGGPREELGTFYDQILANEMKGLTKAKPFAHDVSGHPMQVFDLSKIRDKVATEGQPLYQNAGRGPKGAVEFLKSGKALIHAFQSADLSTFAHETGHVFRRWLNDIDPDLAAKAAAAIGAPNTKAWPRSAEEAWATAWERYLRDGQAPNADTAEAFKKVREAMLNVYQNTQGTPIANPVSPELKGVFDQMLSSDPARVTEANKAGRIRDLYTQGVVDAKHGFDDVDPVTGSATGPQGKPGNPFDFGDSWKRAGSAVSETNQWLTGADKPLPPTGGMNRTRQAYTTLLETGSKLGANVEWMNRVPMYLYLTEHKGWSKAAATEKVMELQADYSKVTPFERDVMKRAVPFYTWQRRLAPVILKDIAQRPGGMTAQTVKLAAKAQGSDVTTPDHIRSGASIPLGRDEQGNANYITGLGMPWEQPLEYFGSFPSPQNALREGISQLHPGIKAPLEWATGQSFFQRGMGGGGRPLEDLDPTLGRIGGNIAGRLEPFSLGAGVEFAFANSPASVFGTAIRKATDQRKPGLYRIANLLTGANISTVGPATQDATVRDRATTEMRGLGADAFTRVYFSKDELARMSPEQRAKAERLQALQSVLAQRAKQRKLHKQAVGQ